MVYTNMKGAMQYSTKGVKNDYVLCVSSYYHYILPTDTYQKYYLQLPRYHHTT